MRRSRGLLIALVAALLELVIVAGTGNQWVTKRIIENTTKSEVGDAVVRSATAFSWRFSTQNGNRALWAGQLIGAGALVVLVFLFVWAMVGHTTRSVLGTFVGIWGVTVLASVLAAAVRQFIAFPDLFPSGRDPAGLGRWANAIVDGPTSTVAIFGVCTGFVVALISAIVDAATASDVTPPAAVVAAPEPDWSPETAAPWGTEYGQAPAGEAPAPAQPGYTTPLPPSGYGTSAANPELAQYATERMPTSGPRAADAHAEPDTATAVRHEPVESAAARDESEASTAGRTESDASAARDESAPRAEQVTEVESGSEPVPAADEPAERPHREEGR